MNSADDLDFQLSPTEPSEEGITISEADCSDEVNLVTSTGIETHHGMPRRRGLKPICRYYLRNKCAWGDRCRFRHPRSGSPSLERVKVWNPTSKKYQKKDATAETSYDAEFHNLKYLMSKSRNFAYGKNTYNYYSMRPLPTSGQIVGMDDSSEYATIPMYQPLTYSLNSMHYTGYAPMPPPPFFSDSLPPTYYPTLPYFSQPNPYILESPWSSLEQHVSYNCPATRCSSNSSHVSSPCSSAEGFKRQLMQRIDTVGRKRIYRTSSSSDCSCCSCDCSPPRKLIKQTNRRSSDINNNSKADSCCSGSKSRSPSYQSLQACDGRSSSKSYEYPHSRRPSSPSSQAESKGKSATGSTSLSKTPERNAADSTSSDQKKSLPKLHGSTRYRCLDVKMYLLGKAIADEIDSIG